jgi:hypothetical protein
MVKGVFITGFERCQAVYVSLKAFNFGTIYISRNVLFDIARAI